MELTNKTIDLLSGFESRMKFVNLIKYLLRGNMPNFISGERDKFDNYVFSVLLFIMEQTLSENEGCTLNEIMRFTKEVVPIFELDCNEEELTKFTIIELLQNSGKLKSYFTYYGSTGEFRADNIKLLTENFGKYSLTDECLDFIFRTKEVDIELDFSVTRFKLEKLIQNQNYSAALQQSKELVSKIKMVEMSINDFDRRCRESITKIALDEYEKLNSKYRSVLEDEHEQLKIIKKEVEKAIDRLSTAYENGINKEKLIANREDVKNILANIELTEREQIKLSNKRSQMGGIYKRLLDESFRIVEIERFNFYDTIIKPIESGKIELKHLLKLFKPLLMPQLKSIFSIESLYARQQEIQELEVNTGIEIIIGEDIRKGIIEKRNNNNINIIKLLLKNLKSKKRFTLKEFIDIHREMLDEFMADNALLNVFLSLYELSNKGDYNYIDIAGWKNSTQEIVEPLGEFDLPYALIAMNDDSILPERGFRVLRNNDFEFELADKRYVVSNFIVEDIDNG